MKGFRQLASYEQLDCYYKWEREHHDKITTILRESYIDFCEHPKAMVNHRCDFGCFVGAPIFILAVLWIASTKSANRWFVAIAMIGFGFLLRYYQNRIIDQTCQEYFWSKQQVLLYAYIDSCLEESLTLSSSAEEDLDIADFYEYCRNRILFEKFPYYEKPKQKRKRTNHDPNHPENSAPPK